MSIGLFTSRRDILRVPLAVIRGLTKAKALVFACLAAAVLLATSSGSASVGGVTATTAKQKIAIEEKSAAGSKISTFKLIPLSAGPLAADSGTFTSSAKLLRTVIRNGKKVWFYSGFDNLKGKHGTMRISGLSAVTTARGGYYVGVGTWKIRAGTGAYAGVSGGGDAKAVAAPGGAASGHYTGYITKS
jgi:hypothetical protein